MSVTWNTKFGGRRVRQEPPTLAEALVAAEAMSDDTEQQLEIAASLMNLEIDEVRESAARIRSRAERTNRLSITAAPRRMEAPRTVVVEYKNRRIVR